MIEIINYTYLELRNFLGESCLFLRSNRPVLIVVDFKDKAPSWVIVLSPKNKIFGISVEFSDSFGAWLERAVNDNKNIMTYVHLLNEPLLRGFAPSAFLSNVSEIVEQESVFLNQIGFYCALAFPVPSVDSVKAVRFALEELVVNRGVDFFVNFDDTVLIDSGWLADRLSRENYAKAFFSNGLFDGGTVRGRFSQLEEICSLLRLLNKREVLSSDAVNIDARFFRQPKFSLGLKNVTDDNKDELKVWFEVAELRSQLVNKFDSSYLFLYRVIEVEYFRLCDEYVSLFEGRENLFCFIKNNIENYLERYKKLIDCVKLI